MQSVRRIVYHGITQPQTQGVPELSAAFEAPVTPDKVTAPVYQEFDYINLPEATQGILNEIMNAGCVNRLFLSGYYQLFVGEVVHHFRLMTAISINQDKYSNFVCTVIKSNIDPLSEGGSAKAYEVIGKIVYRYGKSIGYRFEPDEGKSIAIIRETQLVKNDKDKLSLDGIRVKYLRQLDRKYMATSDIPHLRQRCPSVFFGVEDVTSCHIMRRFREVNLRNLTKQYPDLNDIDYINIMLAAVRALQYQVIYHGKLHRDIKPENMIVGLINGRWTINIIDYEFVMDMNEKSNFICGTFFYIPLEAMHKIYNEKTEVYSLCITLITLICPKAFRAYELLKTEQAEKKIYDDKWVKTADFSTLTRFVEKDKLAITKVLQSGIDVDPNKRPSLEFLAELLEDIKLDIQESAGIIPADKIVFAHGILQLARDCRATLECILSQSYNLNLAFMEEYSRYLKDPLKLALFVDYLGMPCLDGVTSTEQIIDRLVEIDKAHKTAYYAMKALHEELLIMQMTCFAEAEIDMEEDDKEAGILKMEILEKMEIEMSKIQIFMEEMDRRPNTFDNLVKMTKDINRKIKKCVEIKECFEDLIANVGTNKKLKR